MHIPFACNWHNPSWISRRRRMTVENISWSNSTKVLDQARIKLMASGSTIRLATDCPTGSSNICIRCKHQGLRDVLKLSKWKVYRSYWKGFDDTIYVGDHKIFLHAKYVSCLPSWHVFEGFPSQVYGSFMLTWQPYVQYNWIYNLCSRSHYTHVVWSQLDDWQKYTSSKFKWMTKWKRTIHPKKARPLPF